MNTTQSEEVELQYLREENRRLRALVELREDRSRVEQYSIQSRNRLVLLFTIALVALGGSFIAAMVTKRDLNEQLTESRLQLKQIRDAAADLALKKKP
jgi:hypothetical protein